MLTSVDPGGLENYGRAIFGDARNSEDQFIVREGCFEGHHDGAAPWSAPGAPARWWAVRVVQPQSPEVAAAFTAVAMRRSVHR